MEEGPIFAMCMASRGDQTTLAKWIAGLQQTNPMLGRAPTLFRLESAPWEIQRAGETEPGAEPGLEEEAPHRQAMKQ